MVRQRATVATLVPPNFSTTHGASAGKGAGADAFMVQASVVGAAAQARPPVLCAATQNAIGYVMPIRNQNPTVMRRRVGSVVAAAIDITCSAYNSPMPPIPPRPSKDVAPQAVRAAIEVTLNGKHFRHTGDPAMPLLWYLRDVLRLGGCKYGCDDQTCGACNVLVDDKLQRACALKMSELANATITTVEGLANADGSLHPVQQAWIDEDAILCGYCQPGWIMAAVALLKRKPNPTDADIDGLDNLCRCGSHPRIRAAILRAAKSMQAKP